MKKKIILLSAFLIPALLYSQFEQKVSIALNTGIFNTFGKAMGEYDPMQMPNYRPGILADAGLQFNLNRRLSITADIGLMYSGRWSYKIGESDYIHFTITDTISGEILAEGDNKLNLMNLTIGINPKYYLLPGKKLNPYIFSGLTINYTLADYDDNWWKAADKLNILPPDDTGPYDPFLEKNFGIGFFPGIGVEYSPGDKLGFTFATGYSLILLNEQNFKTEYLKENFNAFIFQAGIRLSFLKSKDL